MEGSPAFEPQPDLLSAWFRRVVQSDEGAFEALFRALHGGLVNFAAGITGDRALALDVVQEAFIRFWEQRDRLDPTGSPRGFLYRTVRNLALNQRRDAARRAQLLAERYEPPTGVQAPSDDPDPADRLRAWIDELPERQREALVLSRFEGLSHQEIADVMDLSPRTVNNHLVRGLRTLRDRASAELRDAGRQ